MIRTDNQQQRKKRMNEGYEGYEECAGYAEHEGRRCVRSSRAGCGFRLTVRCGRIRMQQQYVRG